MDKNDVSVECDTGRLVSIKRSERRRLIFPISLN